MEGILKELAADTALGVEAVAVVIIAYGSLEALFISISHVVRGGSIAGWRKQLFVRFGIWLLLGLQFALAADIVRSVISPTWNDIGELAAIAAIRTFLNHFLERDLEEAGRAADAAG
ncbi:MAG TPA: DUF1622 domain-containing protein [Rhizomicrobium sp.]|nr:DUF1622 domain-containing protein [Rhizomicrobium sp.]